MIEVLIVSVPFFKKIWDREIWEEWGGGKQEGRGGSVFLYLFLYYQYMGCQCVN